MRAVAIMLALLSAVLSTAARNDWYEQPISLSPGLTIIDVLQTNAKMADVHARLRPAKGSSANWQLQWNRLDSLNYRYADICLPKSDANDIYTSWATITIGKVADGALSIDCEQKVEYTSHDFSLKLVFDGFSTRLYAGERKQELVGATTYDPVGGIAAVYVSSPMLCTRLTAMASTNPPIKTTDIGDYDQLLASIASSSDNTEGFWEYLDRDMIEEQASLGGKYTLATIKNDDIYEIVYLDGAKTRLDMWHPMMVKGTMRPTIFKNHYDLAWVDANGAIIDDECNARVSDDGAILTLSFPLQGSTLRFRRCAQLHLTPDAVK